MELPTKPPQPLSEAFKVKYYVYGFFVPNKHSDKTTPLDLSNVKLLAKRGRIPVKLSDHAHHTRYPFKFDEIWDARETAKGCKAAGNWITAGDATDSQLLQQAVYTEWAFGKPESSEKLKYRLGPYEMFWGSTSRLDVQWRDRRPAGWHQWRFKLTPAGRRLVESDVDTAPLSISLQSIALRDSRRVRKEHERAVRKATHQHLGGDHHGEKHKHGHDRSHQHLTEKA